MKPTNKISYAQFGGYDNNNLQQKCKVCGYRAGLHYDAEELGKVWCPAKPRQTFSQKLNSLNI